MTTQTYIHRGRQTLARWFLSAREHWAFRSVFWGLGSFLAAAAALGNGCLPISMGLICTLGGWRSLAAAVGATLGSRVFWGSAGWQGVLWAALGLGLSLSLGRKANRDGGVLLSAAAALAVAAGGLFFQIVFREDTPFWLYLARVGLAAGTTWCFRQVAKRADPVFDWLAAGAAVLALAQVSPWGWGNFGLVAAGILAGSAALPAAALAGLALDLARVSPVPMTAVLCLMFLARMLPARGRWLRFGAAPMSYLVVMAMSGVWAVMPLPALTLGGALGALLPARRQTQPRRGETGTAQVRLELMAGVLDGTRELLLQTREPEPDLQVLLTATRQRACRGCSARKQCRDVPLPAESLQSPNWDRAGPELGCRKPGRLQGELARSRERLRELRAQRLRREQYCQATAQQYGFLAEFLRQQADELPRRGEKLRSRFQAEVGVCTAGREAANGDQCLWFAGTRCRYYIILCDGMGTGLGAQDEGRTAAGMLRQMLTAGFPAEYALRSVNSLCCLRSLAGAVAVDLAELCLDSGRVTLYKWGAPPSLLLRRTGVEKIGTAGPPPGLSVTQQREMVERLSLRRGEALILTSDGVDGEEVLRRMGIDPAEPPGEVAALLVEHGASGAGDDATAAVIRLRPAALST